MNCDVAHGTTGPQRPVSPSLKGRGVTRTPLFPNEARGVQQFHQKGVQASFQIDSKSHRERKTTYQFRTPFQHLDTPIENPKALKPLIRVFSNFPKNVCTLKKRQQTQNLKRSCNGPMQFLMNRFKILSSTHPTLISTSALAMNPSQEARLLFLPSSVQLGHRKYQSEFLQRCWRRLRKGPKILARVTKL